MEPISESAFERTADQTLHTMADALGELDELEVDLAMGVLTVKFDDGKRYVINSHRAARQIWMAADSTAWHFDPQGSKWVSTKSQEELWSVVDQMVSRKLGRAIHLPRP